MHDDKVDVGLDYFILRNAYYMERDRARLCIAMFHVQRARYFDSTRFRVVLSQTDLD